MEKIFRHRFERSGQVQVSVLYLTLKIIIVLQFEQTPYSDLRIQACIPSEFLVNPNIWHVKVSLVVYDMVEMHESDRVMQQFEFRQTILPVPQYIEYLHNIDLRGRTDENWVTFQRNISTFGIIGMTLYLIANPLSLGNQLMVRSTCHGLDTMVSHILLEKVKGKQRHTRRPQQVVTLQTRSESQMLPL